MGADQIGVRITFLIILAAVVMSAIVGGMRNPDIRKAFANRLNGRLRDLPGANRLLNRDEEVHQAFGDLEVVLRAGPPGVRFRRYSPDLPPRFSSRQISPITMLLSTALIMS